MPSRRRAPGVPKRFVGSIARRMFCGIRSCRMYLRVSLVARGRNGKREESRVRACANVRKD